MTDLLETRPNSARLNEVISREPTAGNVFDFAPKKAAPALAILVNVSAGAYRFFGLLRLRRALKTAGLQDQVPLIRCFGHELQDKALGLARSGVLSIGVFGGDGSARTVALALRGLDVPTLPLPGGTLNRLCFRVHGHANLTKILRDFARAKPVWLTGGLANEHTFLVASGFGPWMAFQDMRETIRSHGVLKGLSALRSLRRDLFAGKLTSQESGQSRDVVIAAPTFVDAAFGLGENPDEFNQPGLEVAEARLQGIGSTLWLAAHVLARRWRRLDYAQAHIVTEKTIEFDGEEIVGLVDGERRSFGHCVHLRAVQRAALVLSTRTAFEC
ncbi:diacylglycerol kinase family protein [Aquidulcibacter sp.]|uniref:diacylglycerol/lipid kinase family protein n=1 Tax=Aquidulcibacter sp. TaxID=2052990 RepID=UPI0025BF7D57|nr:diacylglycerol kinase family protein [Aquidulcibacter sp.]MCA3693229.1 hypothetical protein [Aquidulcibacter sp.]